MNAAAQWTLREMVLGLLLCAVALGWAYEFAYGVLPLRRRIVALEAENFDLQRRGVRALAWIKENPTAERLAIPGNVASGAFDPIQFDDGTTRLRLVYSMQVQTWDAKAQVWR